MTPTVLIVDDEPHNIELADIVLQKEGYRLLHAKNGEEALALLEEETAHVIVLDLMMAGLDGFGTLERLKADQRFQGIPVLVVTALGDDANRETALASGADAYLVKPYDIIDLKMRVKAMLRIGEGLGNTPSEVLGLWFESMGEWLDPKAKSRILAQLLLGLDGEEGLLVPETYAFIHAWGSGDYHMIGNEGVCRALREGRHRLKTGERDLWARLLGRLNVAIVKFKAQSAGLAAEPLLKSGSGRYYLEEDLW